MSNRKAWRGRRVLVRCERAVKHSSRGMSRQARGKAQFVLVRARPTRGKILPGTDVVLMKVHPRYSASLSISAYWSPFDEPHTL